MGQKKPAFSEAGLCMLISFYIQFPPPCIAGKRTTTTTRIAVNKEVIVFILLCNMKDISFHEYTPADYKKQKAPSIFPQGEEFRAQPLLFLPASRVRGHGPHSQGGTMRRFIQDEQGQDLIEYALLASLVAVVSIAALKALGAKVATFYNTVGDQL